MEVAHRDVMSRPWRMQVKLLLQDPLERGSHHRAEPSSLFSAQHVSLFHYNDTTA